MVIRWVPGLLLLAVPGCCVNFTVTYDGDAKQILDLGVFGYEAGGVLHVAVRQLSLRSEPRGFDAGFVLDWVPNQQDARGRDRRKLPPPQTCYLDSPDWAPPQRAPPGHVMPQVTRKTMSIGDWRGVAQSENSLLLRYEVPEPGLYALVFYVCPPLRGKMPRIRLSARVSQYNVLDPKTGERDYLSTGDSELPFMYIGFAVVFTYVLVVWIKELRQQALHVRKVHQLMALVLVVKLLSVLFEAAKWHSQQDMGDSTFWDALHYIFLSLRGLLLFLALLLMGTGWSTLKPVLSKPDWAVIAVVVPVQVVANILVVAIDETHSLHQKGSWAWGAWRDAMRMLDMVCCVGVLIPTAWLVRRLQQRFSDGKSSRNLQLLRKFQSFYFAVAAYLYTPRAFQIFVGEGLDPIYGWAVPFAHEASAVLFYLYCGMTFSPHPPSASSAPTVSDDESDKDEAGGPDDGGRLATTLIFVPLLPLPLFLFLIPTRAHALLIGLGVVCGGWLLRLAWDYLKEPEEEQQVAHV
eukprot:Hpha_TRINITY_DN16153_c1_g1::TRINITY_DN16153_c1_g1_i2::g.4225::m.4225